MKTIKNKTTQLKISEKEGFADYRFLLKQVVNAPSQGGYSIEEIKTRLRITDLLEGEGDIDIEDADFKKLKELFDSYKWAIVHKDVVELSEEIERAGKKDK